MGKGQDVRGSGLGFQWEYKKLYIIQLHRGRKTTKELAKVSSNPHLAHL